SDLFIDEKFKTKENVSGNMNWYPDFRRLDGRLSLAIRKPTIQIDRDQVPRILKSVCTPLPPASTLTSSGIGVSKRRTSLAKNFPFHLPVKSQMNRGAAASSG